MEKGTFIQRFDWTIEFSNDEKLWPSFADVSKKDFPMMLIEDFDLRMLLFVVVFGKGKENYAYSILRMQ